MTTNFKNLFTASNRAKKTQPRRSSLQPRFESLEDRRMMAATVWETPGIDGKIEVVAVGTTGRDEITVNPYIATKQLAASRGHAAATIQIPMIEVRIKDAAGNSLVRSYEQAKVGELMLYGDQGDDVITNNSAIPSHIRGEGGNDTITGGHGNDTIYGDGSWQQSAGRNTLHGRGGNDHLYGGDLHDELWGGIGDDDLYGGGGDDYLYGEDGKDELFGDGGNDFLSGGRHDDEIWGGLGDDFLVGDSGNDLLVGEAGSDTLDGGIGNDTLIGGFAYAWKFDVNGLPIEWTQEYSSDGAVDQLFGGDGLDMVWYSLNEDLIDGVGQGTSDFWNHYAQNKKVV